MNFERHSTQAYHLIGAEQLRIEKGLYPRDYLHLIIKDDVNILNISSDAYELCLNRQLDPVWNAVKAFLAHGGSRIAIEIRDLKDTWQQQASFVFHLLKNVGTNYCELLLIDYEPNLFSGLLNGAVTAFSHEAEVKIARITTQTSDVLNTLPSLFHHCFSSQQSGHYQLINNNLSFSSWQPLTATASPTQSFSGNVLITGGAGAVGQLLAEHLYKQHHCQVFLTGRKPLSAERADKLKQIKAKAYFQADCAQFEEMQNIVDYINTQHGGLNHIIHLAGNLNDSLFVNKQESTFLNTIEVKLAGAQVIARLSEQFKLRSVVLFSSLSAVTGNIGQTDYAAANASLNELARQYNGKNQIQWFSINWGLWETEQGMQMPDSASLLPMKSEEALALLDLIHANNFVVTTVYNGTPQLLNPDHKTENVSSSQTQLAIDKAQKRLKEIIVECTKIKNLDDDVSLLEKGVDSIIATHIAIHIEKELNQSGAGCKIPKTLIFQHASVNQIFAYLMENHLTALQSVFPDSIVHVAPKEQPLRVPETAKPSDDNDHFAIVAAAGEFPEAVDLHEFWELIKNGSNAIKPIPKQRWDWQEQFSLDEKGKSYCRQGGFIQEAALFDNTYFKITPRDAQKMTPEARRLLHQSYYALEQCNFLKNLEGNVSVFVANMYAHYQNLNKENELVDSSLSAMANHISYAFGFNGASMGVDSMCSGGLNALHVALNSLKLHDCNAVVVGAVNIMSHPGKYRFLSENKFLSPSGKCQSFGIAADGYVPGEGCVVLVIKRLNDAKTANDKILGVIRGSAINSNGAHSAMTVPSATAQAQVIKKALAKSGLNPEDISYIETHGTGTSLGDPIEISGLNQVYGESNNPIAIGSLKSNIGHLEAAAGLASLVKVVLQMHYRMKVPSIHCDIENPLLGLEQTPFIIQKKVAPWGNEEQQIVYAGVSAFGAGGANGHVILESPPRQYAYDELPRAKNKLKGTQSFWIDLQSGVDKIKSATHSVQIEKDKALWMTKKTESSDSPLVKSVFEEVETLFLVTAAQKQMLFAQQHQCLLLDDAVFQLNAVFQQQPQKKYVVVNLTALEESEDDSYLLKHFDFAQNLTVKKIPLDVILVSPLQYQSISICRRAAIDGLYRTLKLEHSTVNTLVMQSDGSMSQIVELLQSSQIKDGVSGVYQYSHGQWHRKVFGENEDLIQDTHTPLLKEGGVYIISGGLGALGQIISKCLLRQYNARVICLGRSALIGAKWEQFQQLKAINPHVAYYQADITDSVALSTVMAEIISQYGQVNGVINSACVLNDGLLREKSFSDFNEVIKSKIQGTVTLDEVTRELALDFFVSFSSMSAVYSNVGQADYCMANTFVDYFTEYREGLVNKNLRQGKSMTLNWPLWEVDGLSLSKQTIEFLCEATGIVPLNEQQGAQLFERLLDKKHPAQIIPLQGDKKNIRAKLLMEHSIERIAEQSLEDLTASVIAALSEVTHQNPAALTPETGINELGMSSVLLTELAGLLEKKSGAPIAPSAFFSYNTVLKIAQYLNQKMPQQKMDVVSPASAVRVDMRAELSEDNNTEFAIIGFSALLPGNSDSETFWDTLLQNKSAVKQVSRWDGEYFAATLDGIKQFDNQFFNLSNREAMLMDPQHRLFLQESYKALLDAGYPPATIKAVGVFAGVQFNDYQTLLSKINIAQHPYMATGNSHAMLANRVSYLFDFNGPSQTVDTACSSTLVAVNRGILALKNNECELALCGAVSLLIDSGVTEAAKSMGVLSPNYRCATFDEQADGYVRGEGAGVFVIKRLKDALRDKDAIHAVITACAENHGGKANSLTAPNPVAQKELLLKAYTPELAGQVSYIETHGTGTKLGDPIEIDALTQAFKELAPGAAKNSILLGSVKTNVGHLEPAAGVASMVKVICALKEGIIPANLHFNKLNPYIDLHNSPFKIVAENTPWDKQERVAGISSFGFGGSYAHVILRQAPASTVSQSRQTEFYFPLSARKPQLLQLMKKELLAFLSKEKGCSAEALSYMLTCRREHFRHRFICKCASLDELMRHLQEDDAVTLPPDELMHAFMTGKDVLWEQYFPEQMTKLHIPGYVFEQKEFWFDSSITESIVELAHE
jgi:acyl transferase domain-containing protein/acyl carrier protein/dTDP-D-glucose 4,6-dehydratase